MGLSTVIERAVYTLAFGADRYVRYALGLARSLRLLGDPTPRYVLTDRPDAAWRPAFDEVIVCPPPENAYLAKLSLRALIPARQALFIDSDSLAFRRLDPIFAAYSSHELGRNIGVDVGVVGWPVSHGDWHGDIGRVCRQLHLSELWQFNAGLLFFGPNSDAILPHVERAVQDYDGLGLRRFRGNIPDEPCLSIAIARAGWMADGRAHLVSDDRDFMNTAVGPIGKLDYDVRQGRCQYLCRRQRVRLVRPILLHAHEQVKYWRYWRQLQILEALEDYERQHPFGYASPGHKLRRSIERRILKITGRLR
ncbi:MAG: hypothetical protein SFX74_00560 [Fimbriimonadaceae bacterium]|nr:hypothetical protein [Fimbriimonadaceae bacterium]